MLAQCILFTFQRTVRLLSGTIVQFRYRNTFLSLQITYLSVKHEERKIYSVTDPHLRNVLSIYKNILFFFASARTLSFWLTLCLVKSSFPSLQGQYVLFSAAGALSVNKQWAVYISRLYLSGSRCIPNCQHMSAKPALDA